MSRPIVLPPNRYDGKEPTKHVAAPFVRVSRWTALGVEVPYRSPILRDHVHDTVHQRFTLAVKYRFDKSDQLEQFIQHCISFPASWLISS